MHGDILILGYGPVGKATAAALAGRPVRIAQRHRPADLPTDIGFVACDVLNRDSVLAAAQGAAQIVLAIGLPYSAKNWRSDWPLAMSNVLAAAQAHKARLIFVDNLYMYGPQTLALHEEMPLQDYGAKPAVRAHITRMWMAAHEKGQVKATALRAPDFYGPNVTQQSTLGEMALAKLAQGQKPFLFMNPDQPHAFAYVPDIARAVVSLLDAPDEDYGQAWHIPCAPIQTPRQILALGAAILQQPLVISTLPMWLWPVIGLFVPVLAEVVEMRFQWDRPYEVESSKFKQRFWSDATPFEQGVAATLRSFASDKSKAKIVA
jgi:nucleoside-diphosphate-sugar epimerase